METSGYVAEPLRLKTSEVLPLTVYDTTDSWDLLFKEHLGATVWVYHVSQAPGHCGMPAVDTSAVPTTIAVVLLYIHRFGADLTRGMRCDQ